MDIEDLASRFQQNVNHHSFTDEEVDATRKQLVKWYDAERRALPWRGDSFELVSARSGVMNSESSSHDQNEDILEQDQECGEKQTTLNAASEPIIDASAVFTTPNRSAYGTWVSEIMLQQTRVETVIPYWYRWMEKYPTIGALAAATPEEVNTSWAGLGYYRRARQLHAGAQQLAAQAAAAGKEPELPSTVAELRQVPGIGAYTAGAIASIAFNKTEGLVDGNVIRVFSRLRMLRCEMGTKDMETRTWAMASRLVDPEHPGSFNQGLMELGATLCKPLKPKCDSCPLASLCQAKALLSVDRAVSTEEVDAATGS